MQAGYKLMYVNSLIVSNILQPDVDFFFSARRLPMQNTFQQKVKNARYIKKELDIHYVGVLYDALKEKLI
jgi:hypothetical protein